MEKENPLKLLAIADPDLAEMVSAGLKKKKRSISAGNIKMLVDETLWGLSVEMSLGRAIAEGYIKFMENKNRDKLLQYRDLTRKGGSVGPTFGRLMAIYLVPVLKHGDGRMLNMFLDAVDVMQQKGTHTLKSPLKSLALLLDTGNNQAAAEYLKLLGTTFSQGLTYSQCQHFSYVLPKTVLSFSSSKRPWQIKQLIRLVSEDIRLVDPFLDGMEKCLYLLSKEALDKFVSLGLKKAKQNMTLGIKFLSLTSKLGIDTYEGMQITVPITQVKQQINHYLRARTGLMIPIRPLSMMAKFQSDEGDSKTGACCDGKFIYLPDEISFFKTKEENIKLYKCLARFESGCFEFNTFDFDLERAREKYFRINSLAKRAPVQEKMSDLQRFFLLFPHKELASDLFTIFEQGRIRTLFARRYPGLVRNFLPVLQEEALCIFNQERCVKPVYLLYLRIALGCSTDEGLYPDEGYIKKAAERFEKKIREDHTVEVCAHLVSCTYPEIESILKQNPIGDQLAEGYLSVKFPFGRKLRPDLFYLANSHMENMAQTVKVMLEAKGYKVYKSEIRNCLDANHGTLSHEDIQDMIGTGEFRGIKIQEIVDSVKPQTVDISLADADTNKTFWYKEWDCNIQDYLNDHVRVVEKLLNGYQDNFYNDVLEQYRCLVQKIKYAFEHLRPEGLKILRQWVEGDEFDYRALLDFVMDKKARIMPSDRLYIKRIKQQRDVAVLLLVDLSRSTANTVYRSKASVLDIEKEAIVLFCEALEVVGDAFAIAGFSGTGRLGVDYFNIKEFDEDMGTSVRQRISAMAPQRSTRMGAAIRHAAGKFDRVSSKVRLMIILSDGFPNDVDYKQEYAIKDTRKAISEVHSKNIYVHSITVNLAQYSKLDDLYGDVKHNIISDIRELPDKLLRIYSGLTR
ncbi:MAG: VWA domain-containing protein [Thermodesulfobacteriota bacterium]|nr:VWA domain-containing protein [Thermodesulfobacteriota bacterium]